MSDAGKYIVIEGNDGTGKSTLLEAMGIAYGLNPEGGSRNYTFSVHDDHSELCDHVRLLRGICRPRDSFLVRSDTLFNLISEMDALEDDQRYFGGRLGQVALLAEILRLANAGSQLVVATHSPILLSAPGAVIYQFEDEVRRVGLEQTMEWDALHRFLEDPDRLLAEFLNS